MFADVFSIDQKYYSLYSNNFFGFLCIETEYSFYSRICRKLARWCDSCMCLDLGTDGEYST
jgi:hypothetical protein